MSVPALGRVGIYLIVAGIAVAGEVFYFGDFERSFSTWGIGSALLVVVGIGMIVGGHSLSQGKAQYTEIRHAIYPRGRSRRPRLPLLPRFSALPSFGALCVAPIVPLAILIWGIHYVTNPIGIWVSLKMPSSDSRLEPWAGGLVVRIVSENHWYLNSTKVSPHDLKEILARELSRGAERIVYLDADSEIEYQEVITATDAIRAARAKIVLLTPRAKTEAARRTGDTTRK